MKSKIQIPSLFTNFTGGKSVIFVEGNTVNEALNNLVMLYYPMGKLLYSESGKVRSTINIYVNDIDIKYLNQEETTLKENDTLKIIPTIAGGV